MLGFILKNDAALQIFRKISVFFGIDDCGTGEMHDITAIFVILMSGILHSKMQIVCSHPDDHFPVIVHLAFQMIIVCTIYQKGNIRQAGAGRCIRILLIRGGFRCEEGNGSSFWIIFAIKFFEERKKLFRHGIHDCFENLIPQLCAAMCGFFRHKL